MGHNIHIKKETAIYAVCLAVLFCLFAWRQFFGFNKNDEIFYISTVYRFFQGDAMLVDEWNNVQLFALITYPIYWLIRLVHNSNEGIILIFRMAYLVFQALVSVWCFCRLKRFGWIRILPALFYFVTTPYNINSMSYNTLAFGFVLLVLVTLAGSENLSVPMCILCGMFTAGAVLANPYVVILFLLYGVICVGACVRGVCKNSDVKGSSGEKESGRCSGFRNSQDQLPAALQFRSYFGMCVGAFLIFLVFVWFVFSRGTLKEILECFEYIVMDTERQKSFWEKLAKYFIRIYRYDKYLVRIALYLSAVYFAARKVGKKISAEICMIIESVVAGGYIIYYGFCWEMVGINYMLIPMTFVGFMAYITAEKKDRYVFWGWFVPGVFYTLLAHFATNTGILTMSASCMIPSAASLVLIGQHIKAGNAEKMIDNGQTEYLETDDASMMQKQRKNESVCITVLAVLIAVQFAGGIWQRVTYVWGDEKLPKLTVAAEEGPLKGIHTSEENSLLYEDVMQDMEDLQLTREDKLFVVGIAPWMYLNTEAECAAYSTWETLETDPLIFTYYEVRPEKQPTVIYCYDYDESILDTEFGTAFLNKGYEPMMMRRGLVLLRR